MAIYTTPKNKNLYNFIIQNLQRLLYKNFYTEKNENSIC